MLKEKRVESGYTQKALADKLGLEYYNVISQIELGYIPIPATLWGKYAEALNLDGVQLTIDLTYEYYPELASVIFGNRPRQMTVDLLTMYVKGQLDHILTED